MENHGTIHMLHQMTFQIVMQGLLTAAYQCPGLSLNGEITGVAGTATPLKLLKMNIR